MQRQRARAPPEGNSSAERFHLTVTKACRIIRLLVTFWVWVSPQQWGHIAALRCRVTVCVQRSEPTVRTCRSPLSRVFFPSGPPPSAEWGSLRYTVGPHLLFIWFIHNSVNTVIPIPPTPQPRCPHMCPLHLRLYFCFANKFCITFLDSTYNQYYICFSFSVTYFYCWVFASCPEVGKTYKTIPTTHASESPNTRTGKVRHPVKIWMCLISPVTRSMWIILEKKDSDLENMENCEETV